MGYCKYRDVVGPVYCKLATRPPLRQRRWKRACQQRRGAAAPHFSAETVLRQLRGRYDGERGRSLTDKSRGRSALQVAMEVGPSAARYECVELLLGAKLLPEHECVPQDFRFEASWAAAHPMPQPRWAAADTWKDVVLQPRAQK